MLATIPVNEMAETLRVLAGANAGNAARHFTKRSHEIGDVAGAVLWTSIADVVAGLVGFPLAEERAAPPVPQRMKQLLEARAFEGVRFEDVDADELLREGLQEAAEEPSPQAANVYVPEQAPLPPSPDAAPENGESDAAWPLPLAA